MAFWLVKSEPDVFSFDQLAAAGPTGEPWTGVRNHAAKLNLMAMQPGERCFYYHSNEGKAVVGRAQVVRAAYPDPTAPDSPWVCPDIAALDAFARPVTLAMIKAEPELAQMALVRLSRLSVQPVTVQEWALVCAMAGVAP